MRTIAFLLALAATSGVTNTPTPKEGEKHHIAFEQLTWEEALAKAKKEDKLIFMDAYASWCGPCKLLDKYTFSDKQVAEYMNENFVNMKINMEKGEGKTLSREYGVTAYPTLFFIDGNGKVVKKIVGYQQPKDLLRTATIVHRASS